MRWLLVLALLTPSNLDERIERDFAWMQFTYDYSQHLWCVDAQRRNAAPGVMVGGCWKTLHEAEKGILNK